MASLAHDVAVVGGGPAGATAALTLARVGLDVVMVEASRYQRVRLGETVPPPARKVLARLGLGANWAATEVTPSFGTSSAWGGPELASNSFISSPYGNGWHLDRRRFDLRLAAGVRLVQGVRVTACTPAPRDTWRLTLDRDGRANGMTVGAVVDATGRRARLARALGARRHVVDRLVGVAVQYRSAPTDGGFTLVEAVRDGWWYSAPVPPDGVMVMFMTDADLCRSQRYADPVVWARRSHARATPPGESSGTNSFGHPRSPLRPAIALNGRVHQGGGSRWGTLPWRSTQCLGAESCGRWSAGKPRAWQPRTGCLAGGSRRMTTSAGWTAASPNTRHSGTCATASRPDSEPGRSGDADRPRRTGPRRRCPCRLLGTLVTSGGS